MELAGIILIGILILLYLLVKQRAEIKLLRNGLSRLFDQLDQLKGHIDDSAAKPNQRKLKKYRFRQRTSSSHLRKRLTRKGRPRLAFLHHCRSNSTH
jgi:hypothetical protein